MVILLYPSVPAKTVPEFIFYAKANPGKINMASAGIGSAPHMAGELFKMMVGVDLVHVPYRGQGPALSDLLGGQVQVYFATAPGTTDYIATGKLRALAVTSASRAELLPELPTVADFVPGYETSQWYGLGAPANTPAEIVDRLNREINAAIADPGMKARFAAIGGEPLPGSPAAFGQLIAEETEKWAKVVRAAGIKPEEGFPWVSNREPAAIAGIPRAWEFFASLRGALATKQSSSLPDVWIASPQGLLAMTQIFTSSQGDGSVVCWQRCESSRITCKTPPTPPAA